jgi:hypothetical protein
MASKLRAGSRAWDVEPVSLVNERDADLELEAEIALVAAWFEALPEGVRAYLDGEARIGRQAYAGP